MSHRPLRTLALALAPALSAALRAQAPAVLDVRSYGAVPNDGGDDTAAIQAAINTLPPGGGTVLLAPGQYVLGGTLTVPRSNTTITGDAAVLLVRHDGVALDVNGGAKTVSDFSLTGHVELVKETYSGAAGSVGVRLRNASQCRLVGFAVQGFTEGLLLYADHAGCCYNLVQPRELKDNAVQVHLATAAVPANPTPDQLSWTNQNTFLGGRWWYSDAFTDVRAQVWIENAGYASNGNLFLNPSFEGPGTGVPTLTTAPAVICDGMWNTFVAGRCEGTVNWSFGAASHDNVVQGGTFFYRSRVTDLGTNNKLLSNQDLVVKGDLAAYLLRSDVAATLAPYALKSSLGYYETIQDLNTRLAAYYTKADFQTDPHIGNTQGLTVSAPTNYLSVGSTAQAKTVGLFLPVADGVQNVRAWLKLDAAAKRLELNHAWTSGGDLDYSFSRDRLVILKTGRVGVGTLTPTATFEVKAGGTTLADAWVTRSSRRFKTDVAPLENPLDTVMRLQGVRYTEKATGERRVGFIAEEVGKVVPEVVAFEPDGKEAQGMAYDRLTAVLVEAVKAQQKQIEALQAEVKALRKN